MKLKDVESQCGLAKSARTLNIEAEGAVKKRVNDNDFLHGVFDNKVDPSSLAFILPILRVTKQKEEEYGIYVIIAYTFQERKGNIIESMYSHDNRGRHALNGGKVVPLKGQMGKRRKKRKQLQAFDDDNIDAAIERQTFYL